MRAPRRSRALPVTVLVAALPFTACAAGGSSHEGSCPAPQLVLPDPDDATPVPGEAISVAGEYFWTGCNDTGGDPDVTTATDGAPQTDITVTLERRGAIVAEVLVDADRDGTWVAPFTIPSDASGTYELKASTATALQIVVE